MPAPAAAAREGELTARSRRLLQAIFLVVAATGVVWAALTLPIELTAIPLRPIEDSIVEGEQFKPEALARIAAYVAPLEKTEDCFAGAPGEVAMFRLRAAATTLAHAHEKEIIEALRRADLAARKALACSPYQPFLWYALYWIDSTATGDKATGLAALEMSYRLGPYEGWISPLRNRAALPLLDRFSPDARTRVLTEFADMARDDTYQAASAYVRADPKLRAVLLPLLTQVPVDKRTLFARYLRNANITVTIPGVVIPDRAPWQ